MNKYIRPLFIGFSLLAISCSSVKKDVNSVAITPASLGIIENSIMPFTLYLTDKIESRADVERKTNSNVFIVHVGHLLKANFSKKENEAILESLAGKGINAVNLTIEDFTIADNQEIFFEKYPQQFLNSSVVDLNEDYIISRPNIAPFIIHQGVALIGLSDKKREKIPNAEKFLVSDYVLSILRARKAAIKENTIRPNPEFPLASFVLVHTLPANEIQGVLDRLPPNFVNSLTN